MNVSLVTGSGSSTVSQILSLSTESSTATTSVTSTSSDGSDSVSISASGSAASGLLELMRERASLVEARSTLASSALEDGTATDELEAQLEGYDTQISELDARIVDAKAAAAEEQASSVLSYGNNTYTKSGSASSSSTDALNVITGMSASLSSARTAASARNRLNRQAETMQAEMDADEARGLDASDKESELETLKEKASSASATLRTGLDDINQ